MFQEMVGHFDLTQIFTFADFADSNPSPRISDLHTALKFTVICRLKQTCPYEIDSLIKLLCSSSKASNLKAKGLNFVERPWNGKSMWAVALLCSFHQIINSDMYWDIDFRTASMIVWSFGEWSRQIWEKQCCLSSSYNIYSIEPSFWVIYVH